VAAEELAEAGRGFALLDLDGGPLPDVVITAPGELELGSNATPVEFIVGDVNRDGLVDVPDIPALFDEMYDGDGQDADSVGGGLVSSDSGADVNRDGRVDAADIPALLLLIAAE
jgi:hypothetical protein